MTTHLCAFGQTPQRLDVLLAGVFSDLSRSQAGLWIRAGGVHVEGMPVQKPGHMVRHGQEIILPKREGVPSTVIPNHELSCPILQETHTCVIINKPLGLLTHPTSTPASFRQSAASWLAAYLQGNPHRPTLGSRPGIVHRLDQWTSGALLLAKSDAATLWYAKAFAERQTEKIYLALVCGRPHHAKGHIDAPIGRDPHRRIAMAVHTAGKAAQSAYEVLAEGVLDGHPVSLLRVQIFTGRTHQVRVHLASIGHPLVGDRVYHTRVPSPHLSGQWLHAWALTVPDMEGGAPLSVVAPLPPSFLDVLTEATIPHPTF